MSVDGKLIYFKMVYYIIVLILLAAGCVYCQTYTVTTLAGSGTNGYMEGFGTTASFRGLEGIVVGADGSIIFCDIGNMLIRKQDPRTSLTSLFAGIPVTAAFADGFATSAKFYWPRQLAIDQTGNLYVADDANHRVRKISPSGFVSTLGGNGTAGWSDGPGSSAMFQKPYGIAVDPSGNVYVGDGNRRIRLISPAGVVSTLAGSGASSWNDGQGTLASFCSLSSLALDSSLNVFVADGCNYRVRKVSPAGNVTTYSPWLTSYGSPRGVTFDGYGNMFVTANCKIYKFSPDGIVTLIVNSSNCIFYDGPGFLFYNYFTQLAVDGASNDLIVADNANYRIRRVVFCAGTLVYNIANKACISQTTANVITIAGNVTAAYLEGSGSNALFNSTEGAAVAQDGTVYVSDVGNNRIRKIDPATGATLLLAGSGSIRSGDGPSNVATFNAPQHLAVDTFNNVLVADGGNNKIRKITPSGDVTTMAGSGVAGFLDGIGTTASFNGPVGIAVSSLNIVYIGDCNNMRLRIMTYAGVVTTLAGSGNLTSNDGYATSAGFNCPTGVAVDKNGFVYVADQMNNRIRKVSPSGYVTTLLGTGAASSTDGNANFATTNQPRGIAVDLYLNVFFSEWSTGLLRKFDPNGMVTTVAGSSPGFSDGAGTNVRFSNLGQISIDPTTSDLIIGDRGNNRIRRVVLCSESSQFDSSSNTCVCSTSATLPSTENCKCPAGYEFNVGKTACVLCGVGKFKSSLTQSSCSDCPLGTESVVNRQSCNNCTSGRYRSNISTQVCIDCPLYASCNITAITSCQTGFKINSAGTACEACPVGTQSSADSQSCVSCSLGSTYRSTLSQTSCQSCPSNAVCSTALNFTCSAGYELTSGSVGCAQCQEGYSKPSSGNSACVACNIGTEAAANKQSCTPCAAGKYRPSSSFNKCIPCPPNGVCSTLALTKCINGWIVNSAGDGCDQCPIGQDSNGSTCSPCPSGSFKPSQSYNTCISCPSSSNICSGSSVSCQTGYYYDANVQCTRNETYFALLPQTTTQPPTQPAFVTVASTATVLSNNQIAVQTITMGSIVVTVTQTTTVSVTAPPQQQQQGPLSSGTSITLDYIGTLPVSPLIFGLTMFGIGLFLMLVVALVCCRRSQSRKVDEENGGNGGMTTTMNNTTSQRTFTNTSSVGYK